MTIAGNNSVFFLGSRRTRDAKGVFTTVLSWRGKKEDIVAFMASFPAGVALDEQPEEGGPMSILEARIGDAQDGTDADDAAQAITTWSFSANILEKDNTGLPILTEDDAGEIRYKEEIAAENGVYSAFFGTFANKDAEHVFKLRAKGTTSYVTAQFVLKKNTSVPATFSGLFRDKLNEVFTRQQVIDYEEDIPAAILAEMPEGEYLKVNLNKEEQPDGRVNVTVEYWHADTWAFHYTRATLT